MERARDRARGVRSGGDRARLSPFSRVEFPGGFGIADCGWNLTSSQQFVDPESHYVTTELDEGPIIEQGVTRVDHQLGPGELAAIGQGTECIALGRAVTWHLEHRVFRNGLRTVVFH
jgi:folate-dependent phosphoribosylglycinamide formyltransferase PurN